MILFSTPVIVYKSQKQKLILLILCVNACHIIRVHIAYVIYTSEQTFYTVYYHGTVIASDYNKNNHY